MNGMWRMMIMLLVAMTFTLPLNGQGADGIEAVMRLLDSEVEDMDGEEVDRLYGLLKHPLGLNRASQSTLAASGLFSRYQVASLVDYRERSGEVMSFMELAAIDGFGEDFVSRIRPFVSLELSCVESGGGTDNELLLRSAVKHQDGGTRYSYDARYRIRTGGNLEAGVGLSRSLDASGGYPDIVGGHIEWRMRRCPLKLITGDFNARFGQGQALWNGMTINSFTSPNSFMRRPSGLTSSASLAGKYAFTGLASELNLRSWTFSLMLAAPGIKQIRASPEKVGLMPAANLTYNWKNGQCGLTHFAEFSGFRSGLHIPVMKTSADVAVCIRGVDVFAEAAYDWAEQSLYSRSGLVFPVGDVMDGAAVLRTSSEEYALAVSGSLMAGKWMNIRGKDASRRRIDGTFSADVTLYPVPKSDTQNRSLQLKVHSQWSLVISDSFVLDFRAVERIRSWGHRFRTDLRSDLHWHAERFSATLRLNLLSCIGTAFLTYAEGGYKSEKLGLHLRQGLFLVDHWDDRIYAYERDVPGSFNVPAYYGRGVWTSFMLSWKPARWVKLYFRAGCTSYPFMKEKKPGKAELRLQSVFDF